MTISQYDSPGNDTDPVSCAVIKQDQQRVLWYSSTNSLKEYTASVLGFENYTHKITTDKRYTRGPLKASVPTALVKLHSNICSVAPLSIAFPIRSH
jgi:hypothetical protein